MVPDNEVERLLALRRMEILDTVGDERFDRVTRLVANLLDVPIALVSLVDEQRQWFKSRVGLDAAETPREVAFCAHAILDDAPLVVENALEDERFRDNPLVQGAPNIRFYAGAPLVLRDGVRLGTLCVIDTKQRQLSENQLEVLQALSQIVVDELRLHESNRDLRVLTVQFADEQLHLHSAYNSLASFANGSANEIQSPMKSIVESCELAANATLEELREVITKTRVEAKKAERVVDVFHRITALESAPVQPEFIRAREVIDSVCSADEARPSVRVLGEAELEADRALFARLLLELLGNVSKHSADGSCDVELGPTMLRIRYPVRAQVEVDPSIFEPFAHLAAGRDGSDVGLAIVARIAELHDWLFAARCDATHLELQLQWPRTQSPAQSA